MTDLDDALDSSTPMFHPVIINAEWTELPPGYGTTLAGNVDDLTDLGQQIGPNGYTVEHSLDDGLPDPVTMTGSNDAGGKFSADLVGRQGNRADSIGWRATPATANGTGTSITVTPTGGDTFFGDYTIAAVAVAGTAVVTQNDYDPDVPWGWKLLSTSTDGTLTLYVFGRSHYTSAPALSLTLDTSQNWSWVAASVVAQGFIPAQGLVPMVPGTPVGLSQTVSTTTHTLPVQSLTGRGYTVGIFVTTGAITWTPGGDGIEVLEVTSGPKIEFTRSPLRTEAGEYIMSAISSTATGTVAAVGIPMRVGDRETMDAMEYFSPFNQDSPIVDFERDTAEMTVALPVVTAAGIISTDLFKGQMTAIGIKGRLAEVTAISKTRVDLDKSLLLPTVYGRREGLTTDWLATYLMAHGGQYAGVAPSPQTRVWVPFYGSLHPFLGGKWTYPRGYEYIGGVETDWRPMSEPVPGPFVTGMYAQQLNARSQGVRVQFDDQPPLEGLPGMDGEYNDYCSQANSRGRMTVWLRGDVRDAAATSLGAYDSHLFEYRFDNRSSYAGGSTSRGGIIIRILGTGQIQLRMGSDVDGYGTLNLTPTFLPSDGEWHFFGVAWDWDAGLIKVNLDSTPWSTTGFGTTFSVLPTTDAALRASGGYLYQSVFSHIPISEFQVETGPDTFAELFTRFWPSPTAPSQNATFRATNQSLEVIAEETPVQGYPAISELARATLSHYRTNETDNFEFLPLSYFGEPDQMTPTVVADTEVNAGELDVVRDPTKTRNVVTLEYSEVRVDAKLSDVLLLRDSILIPRGVTEMLFPLDIPAIELQGALEPYGLGGTQLFDLTRLTAGQITTPSTIPVDKNYMTVNTKADGTGSIVSAVAARIVGFTTTTVTIRFTNSGSGPYALANNGQDVPHLRILGYAVRSTPAYTTTRDSASVRRRGERALTSEMNWIQSRDVAEEVASQLVNILSRPRDEVKVQVMGDPRRVPGSMVTLADAEGTRAEGNWRVLSIVHKGNGPMYVQDLQLVRVLPTGVWDGVNGWDQSSWAE